LLRCTTQYRAKRHCVWRLFWWWKWQWLSWAQMDIIVQRNKFYPAMTAFIDQYSLPNIFFDIGQLYRHFFILVSYK
jgi:hypothetical protein